MHIMFRVVSSRADTNSKTKGACWRKHENGMKNQGK